MWKHEGVGDFLDRVCARIRSREMHPDVRLEIGGHLEQLIAEKEAEGASREEAEAWATRQMGDPDLLGKQLHQLHKPRMNWGMLLAVVLFSLLSLIAMMSVDASYRGTAYGQVEFAKRQSVYIALGTVVLLICYFSDFRRLRRVSWLLYAITLIGMIATTSVYGTSVNGLKHYIVVGPFSLNWIGCSPYFLIVAVTGIWLDGKMPAAASVTGQRLMKLGLLAAPCLIYIQARALPELVVYTVAVLALLGWVTRNWLRSMLITLGAGAVGMLYIWSDPYLRGRLGGALFPQDDPLGSGYMYMQQLDMIRAAGWWGHGFGAMNDKLPMIQSDMLLSYLIYSFGWGAGLLLLAAVIWFVVRMAKAVQVVREPYGRALMLALSVMLAIQLVYGLAMATGRVMLVSLPFPFLGYGSHVLTEFAVAGLLLGIYRRKDMIPVHA